MSATCWASVRGETLRVTALDNCCTPVNKACGVVVTSGFISVKLVQEIDAAAVVKVKNAADKICVYDPGCDSLLDMNVEVVLCQVNPDLVGLMTGQEVVLDYAGNSVGVRRSTDLKCDNRFAIEVWTDVPNSACVGTPPRKQFGYFLTPCIRSATLSGDITIDGTNAVSLTLTGKTTIPAAWGTGPQTADNAYKVVPIDSSNTPGYLLTPIGPTDHDHIQLTTIAPPVIPDNCGCTALTVTSPALPQLVSAEPATALPAAGGTPVSLDGSYFTGVTGVTIGGTAATGVTFVNSGEVNIITPAKVAGSYPVVLTTAAGASNAITVTFV